MKTLRHFSIPIEGMKNGNHEKTFLVENSFFSHFENSPIQKGKFKVALDLDKRPDLIKMNFEITGSFDTMCDRCMADIALPLGSENQLLVKYADEAAEEPGVIYITRDTHHLNVSKFIYDSIILSIPLSMVYDCRIKEPFPCDEEVIQKLNIIHEENETTEDEKNSVWDSLNKLDFGNN